MAMTGLPLPKLAMKAVGIPATPASTLKPSFANSPCSMAALFVIQFIYGWNQYLWPLLVTTEENMYPVVIGIRQMISGGDAQTEWNIVMATAMLAMLPPAMVVMLMQKWFVKGLVDTEK